MIRRSSATSSARERRAERARRAASRPRGRRRSSASATSTVRLPSVRSSPAGLPVTAGSPKTPSRSSRSWKASPSGSPYARQRVEHARATRRPARRRRAAAARRSTSRTCSAAPASPAPRRTRPRACTDTSRNCPAITSLRVVSKKPSASEHPVVRQAAGAQQLVGPGQQQVTEQDGRGGAVLLGVAGPALLAVQRLEGPVRGRPSAAGVGGVHVVVVDQRAGVQQLERGRGPDQRARRVRRIARPRGTPSSRTPPGTACRRAPPPGPPRRGGPRRRRAGRAGGLLVDERCRGSAGRRARKASASQASVTRRA